MNDPQENKSSGDEDIKVRAHTYDGIQEYDQRLPNWWLLTFYGAIVFSIGYWFYYEHAHMAESDGQKVVAELARIEAVKLSSNLVIDDASLWQMSRSPVFVEAGRVSYQSLCAACHMPNLGGPAEMATAIGPSLVDGAWVHGGTPVDIHRVIDQGVLAKGMPAWGPVLGPKKTAEVTAFVLSFHEEAK